MFYASEPHFGLEFSRKKFLEQPLSPQKHMFFQSNLQAIFQTGQILLFQDTPLASQFTALLSVCLPASGEQDAIFRREGESEGAVINAVIVLTEDQNPDLELPALKQAGRNKIFAGKATAANVKGPKRFPVTFPI
jgi:hypothetical protein